MAEYIYPEKIISSFNAINERSLLLSQPMQIGLAETQTAEITDGGYVILDFGKEMCGGIRILTYLSQNGSIRIRFGESLTECCAQISEKNATNDHALRDFSVQLPSYSDMTFGNTGFRFVRLDISGKVLIKSVIAVNHILNVKPTYEYRGTDELIQNIYQTAKRTADLCASGDYLWDGVKRDRLVWIGDIHPEMLALTSLYGRLELIERSLNFVKEQTPLPGWMNNFPTYSLWWIIIVADYFKRTGAEEFTKEQVGYLKELLAQIDDSVSDDGEMHFPDYFLDWPTYNTPDAVEGVRAIATIATSKAIQLLERFGEDKTLAVRLYNKLIKKQIISQSKAVLGLKHFAVGLTEDDKELLINGGAKGMSTFMSYYILKAVASFDRQKAVEMMKEYYGAMLDKGATTFWEDYNLAWSENSCRIDEFPREGQKDIHGDFGAYCYVGFRHSLCHGWSAGVLAFIKEECD